MYIFDFLFYYTALHSEKISKYRAKPLDKDEGARNMIFISTFIWLKYLSSLIGFVFYNDISYLDISMLYIAILSVLWHQFLTIIYIKKKRFQLIFEREHSEKALFNVSEKIGLIIVVLYNFSCIIGGIIGAIIWHFVVYGLPWQ